MIFHLMVMEGNFFQNVLHVPYIIYVPMKSYYVPDMLW